MKTPVANCHQPDLPAAKDLGLMGARLAVTILIAVALTARPLLAQPVGWPTPVMPPTPTPGGAGSGQTSGTPTAPCTSGTGGAFDLWLLDSTAIEIALAWEKVANATGYTVLRCDQTFSTDLPATVNAYGDTGLAANARDRFSFSERHLDVNQSYSYQVVAHTAQGDLRSNRLETAQLLSPSTPRPRGIAGDLWADVVLGKPNFGESAAGSLRKDHASSPGGVLVDRSARPARVYVGDASHNRILGFDHIGHCSNYTACNTATLAGCCTEDADCPGATCMLDYPNLQPTTVLGQPSENAGACNGDSTGQFYPDRKPATDSSLCLIPSSPPQISISEVVHAAMMATDSAGNLYVADTYNNRVLKYALAANQPLPPTLAATRVWGQASLDSNFCNNPTNAAYPCNLCNRGAAAASNNTLCLQNDRHAGVAIDDEGSLWVADRGNRRVLRFPCQDHPDPGVGRCNVDISLTADVVLQGFSNPIDIAFDRYSKILYVSDVGTPSRIFAFPKRRCSGNPTQSCTSTSDCTATGTGPCTTDFSTGQPGREIPIPLPSDPQNPNCRPDPPLPSCPAGTTYDRTKLCDVQPLEIEVDSVPDPSGKYNLWLRYEREDCVEQIDVQTGTPAHTLGEGTVPSLNGRFKGVSLDSFGNLFLIDGRNGVFRLPRTAIDAPTGAAVELFGKSGSATHSAHRRAPPPAGGGTVRKVGVRNRRYRRLSGRGRRAERPDPARQARSAHHRRRLPTVDLEQL
jgi:hypothetical protein